MKGRTVIIVMVLIFGLQVFPEESVALWWLFKKKEQPPDAPPASYSVSSDKYRHDYGDVVAVAGSDNEFVICGTCPKPSALVRELKPVPIALKLTAPVPLAAVPTAEAVPSLPAAHPSVSVSTIGTLTTDGGGSPESPVATGMVVPDPKADEQAACHEMTVYFDLASSRVRDEDRTKIANLSKSLDGKTGVQVKGYTCDIGGKEFNDRLAMERARTVAGVIEKNGIAPLTVSGEGKCCYVSEVKSMNRRVEIRCKAIN